MPFAVKREPDASIGWPAIRDAAGLSESMFEYRPTAIINVVWDEGAYDSHPHRPVYKWRLRFVRIPAPGRRNIDSAFRGPRSYRAPRRVTDGTGRNWSRSPGSGVARRSIGSHPARREGQARTPRLPCRPPLFALPVVAPSRRLPVSPAAGRVVLPSPSHRRPTASGPGRRGRRGPPRRGRSTHAEYART